MPDPCHYQDYDRSMLYPAQPGSEGCSPKMYWVRRNLQGYLAHEKQRPPRTLQQDHDQGPMAVLGWWAVSYERGTPVSHM